MLNDKKCSILWKYYLFNYLLIKIYYFNKINKIRFYIENPKILVFGFSSQIGWNFEKLLSLNFRESIC